MSVACFWCFGGWWCQLLSWEGEWAGMTVTDLSISQPLLLHLQSGEVASRHYLRVIMKTERDERNGKPLWGYLVGSTVAGLGRSGR